MQSKHKTLLKIYSLIFCLLIMAVSTVNVLAQEPSAMRTETKPNLTADNKIIAPVKVDAAKAPQTKKMIQDATINLQTTITGNQEQPSVIYILPWQSPQSAVVDFKTLEGQQKTIFAHVERDELRRELESAGDISSGKSQ